MTRSLTVTCQQHQQRGRCAHIGNTMLYDLLMFPIIGWEMITVPREGLVCIRFPFLTSEMQHLSKADPGRSYVMHTEQARELRDALCSAIQRIDAYDLASIQSLKPPRIIEQEHQKEEKERWQHDRRRLERRNKR
ncbi:MAG: hypothetical protein H0U72_03660 [Nitrosospira sp.]|nr:hypothetical protein [Nitrosospira sp.]